MTNEDVNTYAVKIIEQYDTYSSFEGVCDYIRQLEVASKKEVIDIVRKFLMSKWFTLNGFKILIPVTEIDELCKSIMESK